MEAKRSRALSAKAGHVRTVRVHIPSSVSGSVPFAERYLRVRSGCCLTIGGDWRCMIEHIGLVRAAIGWRGRWASPQIGLVHL